MRHIVKNVEPSDFADWKNLYPNVGYKDLRKEKLFPGALAARRALRASLINEQLGLCCYCERDITSGDFHIEHFKPKGNGLFPELQLEYTNLHASCGVEAAGDDDEHCGHKKGDIFDERIVSPLEPECASHFAYDCLGGISGTDGRGKETVRILNLDCALLRRSRRGLIEYFEDLNETDFDIELQIHLNTEKYPIAEYYSTIEYLSQHNLLLPNS